MRIHLPPIHIPRLSKHCENISHRHKISVGNSEDINSFIANFRDINLTYRLR